jgi:hypothetical protein
MGRPLKIAKAQAVLTITDTTAASGEVTVSQTLSSVPSTSTVISSNVAVFAGMSFIPASSVGGLTGGVTYWILKITGASTFTVSATELSANPTSTPVTLSDTSGGSVLASVNVVDAYFNNPLSGTGYPATNTATYGVVGGNTAIFGSQTLVNVAIGVSGTGTIAAANNSVAVVGTGTDFTTELAAGSALTTSEGTLLGYVATIADSGNLDLSANALVNASGASFVYSTAEPGFIIRQKGKTKYLVKGVTSALVGACYTANVANAALTPNTFNILGTYANTDTVYVQSLNDINSDVFYDTANANAASEVYATFNAAAAANVAAGIYYPVVTINKA